MDGDDYRNVLSGGGDGDALRGGGDNDTLDGGDGNDFLEGGAGDDELRGGAGSDTASYGHFEASAVTVDLVAGTASGAFTGNDRLFSIESARGTLQADWLAGTDGANMLDGIRGADTLVGRGGADQFVYQSRYESTPTAPDRILDFSRAQGDKIDLALHGRQRAGDGRPGVRVHRPGAVHGSGPAPFLPAERRYHHRGQPTDATADAELQIVLDPLVSLQATDFVL